ncbi:MAG: DUF6340 family protein [Prevotellaceae bacterium]|nr:DUF6340 family protein [Prevotellaceae bacterium]
MKNFSLVQSIIVCILISFVLSCQTVRYTTTKVQTLNPPKRNVNLSDTTNIAIVALLNARSSSADSVAVTKIAMSLKESLEESPKYESYIFPVYTVSSETYGNGLTGEQINEIGTNASADYLIALEHFDISDKQITQIETIDYNQIVISSLYKAVIRIYDVKKSAMADHRILDDTVNIIINLKPWELASSVQIPDKEDIILIAGKMAAKNYAKDIAPYWKEEVRYYYLSPEISYAENCIENEEWDKAMNVWMRYVDDNNRNLAAICCFNMAVGCEMIGEYELALKWMENVKLKNEKYYWEEYCNVLNKRITDKSLVNRAL